MSVLSLPAVASGAPLLDTVHHCDALTLLRALPAGSVNCIVTSPPYFGLRDYGVAGQIGLEDTPQAFVARLVDLFREARRVLRDDGTCWINMGDSYASAWASGRRNVIGNGSRDNRIIRMGGNLKEKDLIGIPWRLAFGLQDDGWYLRSDIIWHKPNPMPESVTDRPTKSHEYVFLLSKNERYFYDADAIREPLQPDTLAKNGIGNNGRGYTVNRSATPGDYGIVRFTGNMRQGAQRSMNPAGRNRRTVWTVATEPTPFAHFATFPTKLIEPMIKAGCPVGGVVLDPFMGSGTTGLVARSLGRHYLGCDLNADYVKLARERLSVPYTPLLLPLAIAPTVQARQEVMAL